MKLATWNVNSLKVRLPHLLPWLLANTPDVVCLQETKTEDATFPVADIQAAGYQLVYSGQKTYNGVAILSRTHASEVTVGMPDFADEQKRVLAATVGGVRVVCIYVPNGESVESDKYRYKLSWMAALKSWLTEQLKQYPRLVMLGDYNIAPEARDVHDPSQWEGKVLFSEPERSAFRSLLSLGLKDSFRLQDQPEKAFTWWDYRMNAFKRNLGLRIDHILVSDELAPRCVASAIHKDVRALERPSDHAPLVTELAL